jgi:hypothetical protein
MRTVLAFCLAVLATCPALGEDLFIGVFESETRENFGSDNQGEYRIEVAPAANDKYAATFYYRGKILERQELLRCPVESLDYFRGRAPGRAEVLCSDSGYGKLFAVLAYSENGVHVPAIKSKYIKNSELVKQEGLQPGDPALFEMRHHKAKYYAHVQWFFYGFRKIKDQT